MTDLFVATEIECPLCGPSHFVPRFEKKNRYFYRCARCGIEKQHPLPTPEELKTYYESSYADGMYRTFSAATKMKEMTAARRLKEIGRQMSLAGTWLDVGCSNGIFVREARKRGIDCSGVELSEHAVAQAQAEGLPVRCGTLESLPADETFTCITAFDVLEHVLDPRTFLVQAAERLRPGGNLVLTLPNVRSMSAKLMGKRWYFYIPEEHLHYFEPKTLQALGEKVGLSTDSVRRTFKPLSFNYSLTQFREYNPLIFQILNTAGRVLPGSLREMNIPLYIGEMMGFARKL